MVYSQFSRIKSCHEQKLQYGREKKLDENTFFNMLFRVMQQRLLLGLPFALFPLLLLGCKELKLFEGIDTDGSIRVTPDHILIAPTVVNSESTDTSSIDGDSVDVTVIGICDKSRPCESRHVYVCLGEKCFNEIDESNQSDFEDIDSTDDGRLAYSRWISISGTPVEDGRGCINISREMVHCILTVDGSAQFKVLTSGIPYPYSGGIPIAIRSGNIAKEVGRVWIGYGLPSDTQLSISLADNTKIPMQTALAEGGKNLCNEVAGDCDDYTRAIPFRLSLWQPVSDTDTSTITEDTSGSLAPASVTIDSPVLASAHVVYIDKPNGKAWLSRDHRCNSDSQNRENTLTLRFNTATSSSEQAYLCVNGAGGQVRLSAEVTDYGSQDKILQLNKSITLKAMPQLTRLAFDMNGLEIETDSADTDAETDLTYGGHFSVTALDCELNPLRDADFNMLFEFENVGEATFDTPESCPQRICTPDVDGQVSGTIQTSQISWSIYVQPKGLERCLYTQATVGGAR